MPKKLLRFFFLMKSLHLIHVSRGRDEAKLNPSSQNEDTLIMYYKSY